ncbi:MAG: HAMP domain-containing histidine kinase [Desulfarculus sp.]|nr:HAMP domain-containing histidine kinase [Desulfarculus sp.]
MTGSGELSPEVVQALLQRERLALVGRLLRGVVHNLSGALQMVRLPVDLLEMRLSQGHSDDLPARLTTIQNGFGRVGQELDLLASKAAQLGATEPELLNLAAVAREQLAFWKADSYFKHQVTLTGNLDEPGPLVRASLADLALAFNALVANAVEALAQAKAGGLRVTAGVFAGRPGLAVSDDAPGPAPTLIPRLCQAFTSDKQPPHDGLGLFLAREALRPWGGDISFVSQPEKTFLLLLPPV